jgi:putative ABC transport system substrate-binding protein
MVGASATGLGLLAGCGRLPWEAKPPATMPRIGVLFSSRTPASPEADAFRQGLREYGWQEGENLAIEYRTAEGTQYLTDEERLERLSELAAELVRLPVEILMTGGPDATRAAQQATSSIPIVIGATADAVDERLIDSLARPGGNTTGLNTMRGPLTMKRLELLKDALPGVGRVALLSARGLSEHLIREVQQAAELLALRLQYLDVPNASGLREAFDTALGEQAGAVLVLTRSFMLAQHARVVQLAAERGLPAMYDDRVYMDDGGLMHYTASTVASYRRAAYYVDRIFKGAKPADLPVEQPMTFDFVVNMKTAQALGITFPNEIMLQVTEVIQ